MLIENCLILAIKTQKCVSLSENTISAKAKNVFSKYMFTQLNHNKEKYNRSRVIIFCEIITNINNNINNNNNDTRDIK